MNSLKSSITKLIFGLCFLLIISCEDNSDISVIELQERELKVKNEMLIFKDHQHFKETLNAINEMSKDEIIYWEQNLGFKSKKTSIENAFDELANTSEKNLEAVKDQLKNYIRFNGEGDILGSAFPMMQRAALINEEGRVKIGSDIRIYKNDRLIILVGGDIKRLREAEKLIKSNSDGSIVVNPIKTNSIKIDSRQQKTSSRNVTACYSQTTSGLPRYWRSDLTISTVDIGLAPVPGLNREEFEVDFKTFCIRFDGGQRPLFTTLNVSVSANLSFSSSSSSVGDLNLTYPTNNTTVVNYTTTDNMFSGVAFVPFGADFSPQVTLWYTTSAAGLTCNASGQVINF